MKKIIAGLLLPLLFQTPTLARNRLSDEELYLQGQVYGVLWCIAREYGVNNASELDRFVMNRGSVDMKTEYTIARIALETGDKRQKNVFHNAMVNFMQENCPQYLR